MSFVKAFLFEPETKTFSKLDPRTKIIFLTFFWVSTLLFNRMIIQIILFTSLVLIGLISGFKEKIKDMVKGSLIFTSLIVVINYFYYSDVDVSLGMGLRFLVLMVSSSIFFASTPPEDLGLIFNYFKLPYSLSFALETASRFIPTIALEAQEIIDAQRSRGLELDKGGFLKRIKNYIPILIPLIVNAVQRSLELAESLESRAFGASNKRTYSKKLKFSKLDYLFSIGMGIALAVMIYSAAFLKIEEIVTLHSLIKVF